MPVTLMSRLSDGTLVIEMDLEALQDLWRRAEHDPSLKKMLLKDHRPAIYDTGDVLDGTATIRTVAPHIWAMALRNQANQPVAGTASGRYERVCAVCGNPMKMVSELEVAWVWRCLICKSMDTRMKSLDGGTPGAGAREGPIQTGYGEKH